VAGNLMTTASSARLKTLAERPFDLSAKGALNAHRLASYVARSEEYSLHFATQRVDDTVLAALQELADELGLVGQFKQMRRGAVLNRLEGLESEDRQVLHTACRDLFSGEPAEPQASAAAQEELDKLEAFLIALDQGKMGVAGRPFTSLIHLGIGGSDLGPRAVYQALRAFTVGGRTVHHLANVDPDDAAAVLAGLELETTLVCVVSKSGTTLETLANEQLVATAFTRQGLDPKDHFIAVTGKGSPLDDPAKYLRSFFMYDYIGGRFSTTSMVGAVSLAFALGMKQWREFLEGAWEMDRHAENPILRQNIPLLLALLGIWNRNFLGLPTLAVLPYCQSLHRFVAHLQQCDMESNGKSVQRNGSPVASQTGPILWGEPGTNGQHAFYQLLHQGTDLVPLEFLGFRTSQRGIDLEVAGTTSQQKLLANLYAQILAFAIGKADPNPNRSFSGNRPSSLLLGRRLTPRAMGALLALYEAKIAFQGFAWNINSFDQEGVQLGKTLASRFLRLMTGTTADQQGLEKLFLDRL
jgi:glucose-6-phosphate isomerase